MRAALAVLGLAAACAPGDVGSAEPTTTAPTSAPPAPSPVSSPPTAPAATSPPSTALPLPRAGGDVARTTPVAPTTTTHPQPAPVVEVEGRDDAFWRRLADCECASGQCDGPHVSYFQFSRDTAAKVGIDGSEPYEEQRAAAQEWARRIHPNEGTRSGWPVCWWKAAA